ncbi:TorF family putative porin [Pseudomonas sp.]|uniref:TorF family putative porin n=1 Tax=Pseudomonas sp. TaxID=306 RepID=UPI00272B0EFB|nr:TorF family putative porin [Pseudomonas sp.]
MMKKIAAAVATASTLGFAGLAQAEAFATPIGELDVSMTATIASQYIWRGQSQTDGRGAVQASLDIGHESGLYAGIWGSNVDAEDFEGASVEIDYYVGFAGEITDNFSYDLSWAAYEFPKGFETVYEVLGSVGFYGATLGAKYAYEPSSSLYLHAGYGFEFDNGIGLGLHYGVTDPRRSDDKYADWAVTVGKTVLGLDLALMYSDTDIGSSDCGYVSSRSCGSNWTVSASKTF